MKEFTIRTWFAKGVLRNRDHKIAAPSLESAAKYADSRSRDPRHARVDVHRAHVGPESVPLYSTI